MIIIEGPDNSGKSTLAAFLSYELGIPVYHAGGPPTSVEALRKRVEFIFSSASQFIFDRCPLISEPVYSILRPGGNLFKDDESYYHTLEKLNPILIYCRPPDNVLLELDNHQVKDHDSPEHLAKVMENMVKLVDRYDQVMKDTLPHIRYDYTSDGHGNILQKVRHEIIRLGHYKGKVLRPSVEELHCSRA